MDENVPKTKISDREIVNQSEEEEEFKTRNLPILQIQDAKSDKPANEESLINNNLDKDLSEIIFFDEKSAPKFIVDNAKHLIGAVKNNETILSVIEKSNNNDNLYNINEDINGNHNSTPSFVNIEENASNNTVENISILDNEIKKTLPASSQNIEIEMLEEEEASFLVSDEIHKDFTENKKASEIVGVDNAPNRAKDAIVLDTLSEAVMDNKNREDLPAFEVVDTLSSNFMKEEQEAVKQQFTSVIGKIDKDLTENLALEGNKNAAEILVDKTENIITTHKEELDSSEKSLENIKDAKMEEITNQETSLPVNITENSVSNLPDSEIEEAKEKDIINNFAKVIINTEFLSTISKEIQSIASTWTVANFTKSYSLVTLDNSTQEYIKVKNRFKKLCRSYDVTKIERVENPFLLAHYLLKKAKMTKELGSVKECKMFHGTNLSNVQNICFKNLNWRLRGKARGHKFGQGVSFSPDAFYSSHYTQDKLMFLVRVLVGKSHMGAESRLVPMDGYDTTDNSKETVFVKYEDDDFYPNYVIYYGHSDDSE